MSKKKQKKAFLQTNTGRLLVTIVVLMIVTAFVMSLMPRSGNSRDTEKENVELQDVRLGVKTMMDSSLPPIENLQTDQRITVLAATSEQSTDDMTDGGLFDIDDTLIENGSITPLNIILDTEKTDYQYWVEDDGTVYQVIE